MTANKNTLKHLALVIDSLTEAQVEMLEEFCRQKDIETVSLYSSGSYELEGVELLQHELADARERFIDQVQRLSKDALWQLEADKLMTVLAAREPDLLLKVGEYESLPSLDGAVMLEAAYAEIAFVNKPAIEFAHNDLEKVVEDFEARKRNFGK